MISPWSAGNRLFSHAYPHQIPFPQKNPSVVSPSMGCQISRMLFWDNDWKQNPPDVHSIHVLRLVSWVKSSQNLRNILWKTNIRNPQRQFSPSNRFKGLGIFPRLQSPPPAAETKAWNLRGRSRKRLQTWWLFEGRRARGFWLNLAENEKTEWWIYGKPNNKPSPKRHHFLGGFNHPLKWQVALGCPQ